MNIVTDVVLPLALAFIMFVFAAYTYIGVWLHYFCTEREDFKVIYGKS